MIGHSFVKRLLTSAIAAGKRNLGLDYTDFTVILHGVSGLKRDQFEKEVRQLVSCVQSTIVFFEVGYVSIFQINKQGSRRVREGQVRCDI